MEFIPEIDKLEDGKKRASTLLALQNTDNFP